MKVGVPQEVKNHEYRVAITPIGVHELTAHGHDVYVERSAGVGSQIDDSEYEAAGAKILDSADEVWGNAEMVLKVKEPIAEEYHRMHEGLTLFTMVAAPVTAPKAPPIIMAMPAAKPATAACFMELPVRNLLTSKDLTPA